MAPFSDAVILRNLSDEGCIPNLTVVHPSFGALFVEGTPVDIEVDHGCPETGWSAYKLRLSVVNDGSIAPTVSDGPRQTAFGLGPGFHAIQIDLLDANTREQCQGSAFVAIVVQSAGDVDDSSRFVTVLQQWRTKLSEEPRPHLPQVSGAAPRVLFVKHAGSGGFAFSGTSRSTLWQMETLFHRGFETDLLALVGQEGIEPSEKFFDDAFKQLGRDYLHRQPPRVLQRQVTCRVSTCPLLWDIMENELPAVESFSQAPRALREAFESLLLLSSEYNVIVGSLGEPLTEALFHLVRLRFPRIRRVALLAGGVDLLRDPHRMHVFLAPSFYVADHDTIRRSGVPVRTIPYGFDTFRTWNPEIVTPPPFGGQSQDSKSQAVSGSVHAASDDSAPLVVVFSGRLSAEKGMGQLLLAWGILQERLRQRPREDGRPVVLWVIGGGADQRYQSLLQELATELSAEESVRVNTFLFNKCLPCPIVCRP